jgi:hypothetical protein
MTTLYEAQLKASGEPSTQPWYVPPVIPEEEERIYDSVYGYLSRHRHEHIHANKTRAASNNLKNIIYWRSKMISEKKDT